MICHYKECRKEEQCRKDAVQESRAYWVLHLFRMAIQDKIDEYVDVYLQFWKPSNAFHINNSNYFVEPIKITANVFIFA